MSGEPANLYPRVTGLPKTVGAAPGITVTAPTPGTYRFKGSTTTEAGTLQCNIFVNTTGEVDKTFTPRLYKID